MLVQLPCHLLFFFFNFQFPALILSEGTGLGWETEMPPRARRPSKDERSLMIFWTSFRDWQILSERARQ